jgi:hypothetical protein
VKRNIRIGVFAQVLGGRRVLELIEQVAQFGDLSIARVQGREPGGHGLERGPHLDHFYHLAF